MMNTPQLLCSLLACGLSIPACNRVERDANAGRAKEQVKAVAARAGEQLADSWLTTKIQAQFFADEDVKARHINVATRDGVVTLTGFVDSPAERQQAVETARNTDGVKTVNDRLTQTAAPNAPGAVATSGAAETATAPAAGPAQTVDDAQVTARVQSKFFVDERVKERRIAVDTRNGVVTLSGEVASEEERAQALLLARTTEGVQRVEDHLAVNVANVANSPQGSAETARLPLDDAAVATTIQAKYFVDPAVKTSTIDVTVKDGVVLLQGTVADEAAHQQAVAVARSTEGAVQVVDRLSVAAKRR